MMLGVSCYEILGVGRSAGEDEIRIACEDRLRQADAAGWFARLALDTEERAMLRDARDTLVDPVRRAEHDRRVANLLPVCPPA